MKQILVFACFKNKSWWLVSQEITTTNGIDATILEKVRKGVENQYECKDLIVPLSCFDISTKPISIWHLTFLLESCVNPYKPPTKYIHCTAVTEGALPSNIFDEVLRKINEEEPDYKDYHLINSLETIKNIEPLKEAT